MAQTESESVATLLKLAKKQAEENKKLRETLEKLQEKISQKQEDAVVNLAEGSPRRSPRLKKRNRQVLRTPKKEEEEEGGETEGGRPLKRALSFEDALKAAAVNGSSKKRQSKPKKIQDLRKKLLPLLSPLQDDVMEGPYWDEEKKKLNVK